MRILAIILVTFLALAGCGKPKTVLSGVGTRTEFVTATSAPLTDDQKIAVLRQEAHKRKLHWYIHCYPDDELKFVGKAFQEGDTGRTYIEDGAKPHWFVSGFKTQAEAVDALYQDIQGDPDIPAPHRPVPQAQEHEHWIDHCPPELRGN